MREGNHVQSRLFTTLASHGSLEVVEVDDSYAGMMAVRKLADSAFGKEWGDGGWIGSTLHDDCMLDSYWNWMACDEHRKILLLRDGAIEGFSYLTYYCKLRGICWMALSPNPSCPVSQVVMPTMADDDVFSGIGEFNSVLTSDTVLRMCDDVFDNCQTWDEYVAYVMSTDPARRRIAAIHHLPSHLREMGARYLERLAVDPDWRVRRALAMNDCICERLFARLCADSDWRVRRACCLCMEALNPWAIENITVGKAESLAGLMDDPEFEVRIAAVEYALHAPREVRSMTAERLLGLEDGPLREAVMMKMLE